MDTQLTTIKAPRAVVEAVRAEARKRRLKIQDFVEDCLRTGLRVRGVEIGDPR